MVRASIMAERADEIVPVCVLGQIHVPILKFDIGNGDSARSGVSQYRVTT